MFYSYYIYIYSIKDVPQLMDMVMVFNAKVGISGGKVKSRIPLGNCPQGIFLAECVPHTNHCSFLHIWKVIG